MDVCAVGDWSGGSSHMLCVSEGCPMGSGGGRVKVERLRNGEEAPLLKLLVG